MIQKLKDAKGFTIIEVLIVLAIAGLIMLVVFLAVPALQRGQRNNARQNDVSLLASAINDCVTNNNGKIANCQAIAADKVNYDSANANQLTTAPTYSTTAPTTITTAVWQFGYVCNGAVATTTGATARNFVIQFVAEGATANQPRCLAG